MNATVRDVMSTGVIAVRGDTSFKEMAGMLGSSRVSGFPVIDEAGKVVGVVSETDMLIKEADRAGHPEVFAGLRRSRDHQKAGGVTAAELMTSPPVTIGPDEPVQHAAFLMYDRAVERLPVVDEAGHLIGIVSQVDVLSIFSLPDEEIRREATDGLIRQGFRVEPEHLKAHGARRPRDPVRPPGSRAGLPGHHRGSAADRADRGRRRRPGQGEPAGRPHPPAPIG